ncbi:hypothetical protein GCM10009601_53390 [Streptomyces thermospinosisporus]|uniref:DUF202 domain-containing protein n=2 Tax=Streptomyces thermospinosisporus TaxID=161482 RepID=A0ABN1Z5I2_9ACTN
MDHTDSPEQQEAPGFSPVQYVVPYLSLVTGKAGVQKTSLDERPTLFWVFTAIAALGVLSAVVELRRMHTAHRHSPLPRWTRFLGLLLALFGAYVVSCVGVGVGVGISG